MEKRENYLRLNFKRCFILKNVNRVICFYSQEDILLVTLQLTLREEVFSRVKIWILYRNIYSLFNLSKDFLGIIFYGCCKGNVFLKHLFVTSILKQASVILCFAVWMKRWTMNIVSKHSIIEKLFFCLVKYFVL